MARCRSEYESFERKDIQYHENLKAQKSNLRRRRDQRKKNETTIESKKGELAELEASLTTMQKQIEEAQEKREKVEESLQTLLLSHKREIDEIKEKRRNVEVWKQK